MSHQDQGLGQEISLNHRSLREAIYWLLSPQLFREITFRKGANWTPFLLVSTALLWAWGSSKNVTERFQQARKIITKIFRLQDNLPSYQAFMKVLRKWTGQLLLIVVPHFRSRMQEELPDYYQVAGFVVLAVDGSRVELPRTQSNQEQFSAGRGSQKKPKASKPAGKKTSGSTANPKRKRPPRTSAQKRQAARNRTAKKQRAERKKAEQTKKQAAARKKRALNDNPQMWLTMMWHVGSGLPWDWRRGPSDSSEREHLLSMLEGLPAGSLVTADAGFVGYESWKALIDSGRHLVIRVGANVRLLKGLGYVRRRKDIVYLWPDAAAKKKQPPLVLRLTQFQTTKQTVYLVTDIQDEKVLSDSQLVEIYKLRWGVEVMFRSFKQTFSQRKLRCHRAENAAVELDWLLTGLWAVCFLGQKKLLDAGEDIQRLSVAGVLRAIRQTMHEYKSQPDADEDLWSLLTISMIDNY
ncbi:MAG: transposase, partial [Pirellulaceae bacterium]|nr:transposase [Pirellulaceae bacterium]